MSMPATVHTIEKMFALVSQYRRSDLKASRLIYEIAAEKSSRIGNDTLLCKSFLNCGVLCNELGDFNAAGNYLRKADQLAEKSGHLELQIKVLGETGRMYVFNDQPEEALRYYIRVVEKCKEPKFNHIKSIVLGNIGGIYYEKSKTENDKHLLINKGLPYTKESFFLAEKLNNKQLLINQGNNLALMYADLSRADSSMYYLDIIKPLIQKDNLKSLSTYFSNLGKVQILQGKPQEALVAYKQSLSMTMQTYAAYDAYNIYKSLSVLYEDLGQIDQALLYEKKAGILHDSLVNAENFKKLVELQSLYEKEKSEGQIMELKANQSFQELQISKQKALSKYLAFEAELQRNQAQLFSQKNQMQALEIGRQSDRLEKNRLQSKADSLAIKLTLQDNTLKANLIKRQRYIGFGLLLTSLFLSLFATGLYALNQSRKKAYKQLADTNEAIKVQSEVMRLQTKTIAGFQAQMSPHFVFNALHKVQGSILSGRSNEAALQVREMAGLMRSTFDNANRDEIPLEEELSYLHNYLDFEQKYGSSPIAFYTETFGDIDGLLLPPMMLQPLIENSLKHGFSLEVKDAYIKLIIDARQGEKLFVCIEDNGKGILKLPDAYNEVHALSILKSRVALAFGHHHTVNEEVFKVVSPIKDGGGTKIEFYLPLKYAF